MSLIDQYMHTATRLIPTETEDGEGGQITEWIPGETFQCAITYDDSVNARRAEKDGVTDHYTVTTKKDVSLVYGDVFTVDNVPYRVTSDHFLNETPASASINMRQVRAERWKLP